MREESGHPAVFHFLGRFLRGGNSFLHGDRVFGATVRDCVTKCVAAGTSGRRRTLWLARSRGCRLSTRHSLEGGYQSFKGFDPFVTGVEKICDITVKERDKVVDPNVECANQGDDTVIRALYTL